MAPLDVFTIFPELPVELRLKTWALSIKPRVVEFDVASKYSMEEFARSDGTFFHVFVLGFALSRDIIIEPTVQLSVNYESREESSKVYDDLLSEEFYDAKQLEFGLHNNIVPSQHCLLFNFQKDILFVKTILVLLHHDAFPIFARDKVRHMAFPLQILHGRGSLTMPAYMLSLQLAGWTALESITIVMPSHRARRLANAMSQEDMKGAFTKPGDRVCKRMIQVKFADVSVDYVSVLLSAFGFLY